MHSKTIHPIEPVPVESSMSAISHRQRREIQAPIAACLIRGFAAELGLEKALEIAAAAIREDAKQSGRLMAEKLGANNLDALWQVVSEVWSEGGAVSLRIVEKTEHTLNFDVTRCQYAELYEAMGIKELGYCLSCCRDEAFAHGLNPDIKLTRQQTIMQGATHCDFRFSLVPRAGQGGDTDGD